MGHVITLGAEDILDIQFDIPGVDFGFIRLVDYLGGDSRIVQSARVSYGEGTKTIREDQSLINYLIKNEHTSPLEQVVLTFHVKLPIFIARQWMRHRTGRYNEISGRYSLLKDEYHLPREEDITIQDSKEKQCRTQEKVQDSLEAQQIISHHCGDAFKTYKKLLKMGVARELARIVLPLATFTEMYWEIDLNNLLKFLKLRMSEHAQKEMRSYAKVIFDITKKVAPYACEAWEKHQGGDK